MLVALIAAPLAAAYHSNLTTMFNPDDVPVNLITRNRVERVVIALTARPDGKVIRCSIEATSGNPKLDSYTCNLATRRAKFSTSPTYFVERANIDWWVGDGYPPKSNYADLSLTVSGLPPNLRPPVLVGLLFAVDSAGNISGCGADFKSEPAALVPIACEQLAKTFRPQPARTEDGSPVVSQQNATVIFDTN